jgi:hypothetical protein
VVALTDAEASRSLRQESTVEIDDRRVTVVSEVLIEPELLIITTVFEGNVCIKKTHLALPSTVARDYQTRGRAALASSLQLQHLRYVRHLVSRDEAGSDHAPGELGVLATLALGPSGELLRRGGEEHVPGAWLRAAWVVGGMGDSLGKALALGRLERAELHGADITGVITHDPSSETHVKFLDPRVTRLARNPDRKS